MKKLGTFVCVFAVVLIVASVSEGTIANGPGGRMYFSGPNGTYTTNLDQTYTGVTDVVLRSVVINADWTIGTFETHGDPITNARSDWSSLSAPINLHSPEIEVNGAKGYSTVVMGLWCDNSPASNYTGTPLKQTMDVLSIATGPGSRTINYLSTGRALTLPSSSDHGSTDGGTFALPDPAGGFVGPNGGYITNGHSRTNKWSIPWAINRNVAGTADIADDDADYILRGNDGSPYIIMNDAEILGSKLFYSLNGQYKIYVVDSTDPIEATGGSQGSIFTEGVTARASDHLAAVMMNGHEAVAYWLNSGHLGLSVDLDDSGSCTGGENMDLGAALPGFGYHKDLEFITGLDGKLFIVGFNGGYGLTASGTEGIGVVELLADYTLGENIRIVLPGTILEDYELNSDSFNADSMEFASVIPEPATWLLLGTGALGAFGYIRRQRMK